MYPYGEGGRGNHSRDYCSDGVPVHFKLTENKQLPVPPWPQPEGIYIRGKSFSAVTFLTVLRHMYEKVVIEEDSGSLTMEYEAFALALSGRITHREGVPFFELYPELEIAPSTPLGLVTLDPQAGKRYLRMECLRDE